MYTPLLVQLSLFAAGGVVMLATGAWILPGVPFLVLIKLLHHSRFHLWTQQTHAYKAAARLLASLSKQLLVDPRDGRLMAVSLGCAIASTVLTAAVVLQHVAAPGQIHWRVVLLRQALMTATLVLAFTAKHQESHRSRRNTYKHAALQALAQRINEWWTGIFYGNVPEVDRCGHGFVHHRNEVETDDWANAHLDRANAFHFMQWVITAGLWHNSGVGLLVEFYRSGCSKLIKQTAAGMAVYYLSAAAVLALAGPQLFLVLFAWPFLANVGFASVVNWSWHIFADPTEPHNYAACTITVLNWPGDVFSEGFHLTHHLNPVAHYSDMCQLYDANRDYYIANNSLLLTNSDPLEIWAMSLLHQWGYFSSRLVDFSGKMTGAQKQAFVRYRARPMGSKPADALEASAAKLAAAAAAEAAVRLRSGQQLKRAKAGRPMVTVMAGVEQLTLAYSPAFH